MVPEAFPGNWMVNERVVVECRLMRKNYAHLSDEDPLVPTLDLSMPIDEETYLTCSGHIAASLLDTRREASCLILSHLRPVNWVPDALVGAGEVAQKDTILNEEREFSPQNQLFQPHGGVKRPYAGLVLWLKGPPAKTKSFAHFVAESTEKPFVQKDLLSFLGGDRADGPVRELLTSLKPTINWQCVIFLENCGTVMERRDIDKPVMCFEITQFSDMLRFFPGIIFLSPGTVRDPDPLFDELSVFLV